MPRTFSTRDGALGIWDGVSQRYEDIFFHSLDKLCSKLSFFKLSVEKSRRVVTNISYGAVLYLWCCSVQYRRGASPQLFNIKDDLWEGRNRHCKRGNKNMRKQALNLQQKLWDNNYSHQQIKTNCNMIMKRRSVNFGYCMHFARFIVLTLDELLFMRRIKIMMS